MENADLLGKGKQSLFRPIKVHSFLGTKVFQISRLSAYQNSSFFSITQRPHLPSYSPLCFRKYSR